MELQARTLPVIRAAQILELLSRLLLEPVQDVLDRLHKSILS